MCSSSGGQKLYYTASGIITPIERLNMKISTNQYLTTMMTGHGNIKSYLYRFKLITSPTCPCGKNDQTTDHLLYESELLKTQRHNLKTAVSKAGGWPTSKNTLISNIINLSKDLLIQSHLTT